jgi:hypothetical protein
MPLTVFDDKGIPAIAANASMVLWSPLVAMQL